MPTADRPLQISDPSSILMILALSTVLTLAALPQDVLRSARPNTEYTVRATTVDTDASGNIPVEVDLVLHHPDPGPIVLQMPHWTPGSYRLRDFPDRVEVLDAKAEIGDDTLELAVREVHRGRFLLSGVRADRVTVRYRVDLVEADRFMHPGPGREALTYEGPQMYLYRDGAQNQPCVVHFDLPDGWSAASGLRRRNGGGFYADDYDFLADCPVKLGKFRRWEFYVADTPIEVVLDGADDLEFDDAGWIANIQKVVESQTAMFGGLPLDRYTFLFTGSRIGKGGGLEHLTSTAIGVRTGDLLRGPTAKISTIAHEFFHLWNVKRARPVALGPFDYTRPNRTTMLWLCEGFTSYYTDVTLARIGLRNEGMFWNAMRGQISRLENNPARHHISSGDASWMVWDSLPGDRRLSYYNSGEVLGLLLDIEIRDLTDNRRSLDDLMRALVAQCDQTGVGYDDRDIERQLFALTGKDFTDWFDAHVRGLERPDYPRILAKAGIDCEVRDRESLVLRGLTRVSGGAGSKPYWVSPDARSATGSLRSQGVVVAIDGKRVDGVDEADEALDIRSRKDGEMCRLKLLTPGGNEIEVSRPFEVQRGIRIGMEIDGNASPGAIAIREGILTGVPRAPFDPRPKFR